MIHLFHGDDQQSSRTVFMQKREDYEDDVEIVVCNGGQEFDLSLFQQMSETRPMFGEVRVIAVEGAPPAHLLEDFSTLLMDLPAYTDVVIWADSSLKKSHRLVKTVTKAKGSVVERKPSQKEDVFTLLNNMAARQWKKAHIELLRLYEQGIDPHYILSMMYWQVRTLLQLRHESSSGKKLHPFVQQKNTPLAQSFPDGELELIYKKLLLCDIMLKEGKIPQHMVLERLLLEQI